MQFITDGYDVREPVEVRIMVQKSQSLKQMKQGIISLQQNEYITTTIASKLLNLSSQRTRAILSKMAKEKL